MTLQNVQKPADSSQNGSVSTGRNIICLMKQSDGMLSLAKLKSFGVVITKFWTFMCVLYDFSIIHVNRSLY